MKRLILIIVLFVVIKAMGQSFNVDTLYLIDTNAIAKGELWYLRVSGDTLFLNADTIIGGGGVASCEWTRENDIIYPKNSTTDSVGVGLDTAYSIFTIKGIFTFKDTGMIMPVQAIDRDGYGMIIKGGEAGEDTDRNGGSVYIRGGDGHVDEGAAIGGHVYLIGGQSDAWGNIYINIDTNDVYQGGYIYMGGYVPQATDTTLGIYEHQLVYTISIWKRGGDWDNYVYLTKATDSIGVGGIEEPMGVFHVGNNMYIGNPDSPVKPSIINAEYPGNGIYFDVDALEFSATNVIANNDLTVEDTAFLHIIQAYDNNAIVFMNNDADTAFWFTDFPFPFMYIKNVMENNVTDSALVLGNDHEIGWTSLGGYYKRGDGDFLWYVDVDSAKIDYITHFDSAMYADMPTADGDYVVMWNETTKKITVKDSTGAWGGGGVGTNYWTLVDAATDTLKNNVALAAAPGVIALKSDLFTDRWGKSATNTWIGRDVAGSGNLSLSGGSNGTGNVAIGYKCMEDVTTGYWNVAIGSEALTDLTSGYGNMAIGYRALYTLSTTNGCVAIGGGALQTNTGAYNIGIGPSALSGNTNGFYNTAIGRTAGLANTSGDYNTVLGESAFYYNSTGNNNTAIGRECMKGGNTYSQSNNTAVGYKSLYSVGSSGDNNTTLGMEAGYSITTGDANVMLGYLAGRSETGSNKLYIENSNITTPLIYGEFDNDILRIYGTKVERTDKTIADNDATPDVSSSNVWTYAGSANAVTITDLDNPDVGAIYYLIGNSDTYTMTIGDSGNFNLSASWTGGKDDILILYVQADNDYIEFGRVDN